MSIPIGSAVQPDSDAIEKCVLPTTFCEEIAPQAKRYAMSIVRRWSDAEEIVQEAFCRMIQTGHSEFESDSAGKAILFAIVRNLAIDQLRKNGGRRMETIENHPLAKSNHPSNDARLKQLETGVEQLLKEMPTQWADAMQLKINGELSYAEISQIMNATHAQVRTWIYRARKQLEKDLKRIGLWETEHE